MTTSGAESESPSNPNSNSNSNSNPPRRGLGQDPAPAVASAAVARPDARGGSDPRAAGAKEKESARRASLAIDAPPLRIPSAILEGLRAHARAEAPLECCGLLAGEAGPGGDATGGLARTRYPIRNAARSRTRFLSDSRDLLRAHKAMRARGETLLAIYHSHPAWAAIPSRRDVDRNHYGDTPCLIVSTLTEPAEVRVWRLGLDYRVELPWVEVEGEGGPEAEDDRDGGGPADRDRD